MAERGELLIITPTPVVRRGPCFVIDKKFVGGAVLSAGLWNGSVRVLAREARDTDLPFADSYRADELPFTLDMLASDEIIESSHLTGASVILASGDEPRHLPISRLAAELAIPLAFTIENPLRGSLEIIWIERHGLFPRLKASLWAVLTELKRWRAIRLATGVQANGTPAQASYRRVAHQLLPFFDTRMATTMFSTDEEVKARAAYRNAGNPLRLAFSGRLERIKGVDHLLELAQQLRGSDFPYTLDVYGTGAMEPEVREAAANGLLQFHGAVDFEGVLVPALRANCDLFICCHRQSDPSCTYLEALGCGAPILGYANRAFRGLMDACDGGWVVPKNSVRGLVAKLDRLNADRDEITRKATEGRDFSRAHSFEATFERRIGELKNFANTGNMR